MKNSSEILTELKKNKSSNVNKLVKWKIEDLNEMHNSYLDALSVSKEVNDLSTVMILEEKISQLAHAKNLVINPAAEATL